MILDGGGCTGCNVIEVYGSFVHIENLAIAHAIARDARSRPQARTTTSCGASTSRDVQLGIGSQPDQTNFYFADNILEGRLVWPCVYACDDTARNGTAASTACTPTTTASTSRATATSSRTTGSPGSATR